MTFSLIVGLGNPGAEYERTRHNAGFWFVDQLARRWGVSLGIERRYSAELGRLDLGGASLTVLKPTTYMNRSGRSVAAFAGYFKLRAEEILVVHDELDFEPGVVRLKKGGGHGGHNGLKDIMACLGSRDFYRLRVGVGHPGDRALVVSYVLGRPAPDDRVRIDDALTRAVDLLPDLIEGRMEAVMTSLHTH